MSSEWSPISYFFCQNRSWTTQRKKKENTWCSNCKLIMPGVAVFLYKSSFPYLRLALLLFLLVELRGPTSFTASSQKPMLEFLVSALLQMLLTRSDAHWLLGFVFREPHTEFPMLVCRLECCWDITKRCWLLAQTQQKRHEQTEGTDTAAFLHVVIR